MTGESEKPQNIDVGASLDKSQIVDLIANLQSLLQSA
jgi:hypothetical protein